MFLKNYVCLVLVELQCFAILVSSKKPQHRFIIVNESSAGLKGSTITRSNRGSRRRQTSRTKTHSLSDL